VGWLLALRRQTRLAILVVLAVAASLWVNGAMQDWWGSDSFGQRRLLGLTPVFATGMALILDRLRERPLVAPALVLAFLAAWNVAFTGIFNARLLAPRGEAVSLDRLLPAQADVAYRNALAAEPWLPAGVSFFLHDNLRGVYVDEGPRSLDGVVDLGAEPEGLPLLGGGWGENQKDGERDWRRARGAYSIVRLPVRTPGSASLVLVLRPAEPGTALRVHVGDRVLAERALSEGWSEAAFRVEREDLRPGWNEIGLEWTRGGVPVRGGAADVDRVLFSRPRFNRKGG
jgi:hypothetical protein